MLKEIKDLEVVRKTRKIAKLFFYVSFSYLFLKKVNLEFIYNHVTWIVETGN